MVSRKSKVDWRRVDSSTDAVVLVIPTWLACKDLCREVFIVFSLCRDC